MEQVQQAWVDKELEVKPSGIICWQPCAKCTGVTTVKFKVKGGFCMGYVCDWREHLPHIRFGGRQGSKALRADEVQKTWLFNTLISAPPIHLDVSDDESFSAALKESQLAQSSSPGVQQPRHRQSARTRARRAAWLQRTCANMPDTASEPE